MLDKSYVIIITNDMVFGWKRNVKEIHCHPLINHIHIVIGD
jgi:hypothetical protein